MKPLAWIVLIALGSCTRSPRGDDTPPVPSSNATSERAKTKTTYGAALGGSATVSLAALRAEPSAYAGKTVTVAGTVKRACSRKGCWMELGEEETTGCRVTFKDYGFFVPTDSAGASATVEGEVVLKTVPRARVEHLEEEGATFADKNEDGSANELTLVATGVELRR